MIAAGRMEMPQSWHLQSPDILVKPLESSLHAKLCMNKSAGPSLLSLSVSSERVDASTTAREAAERFVAKLAAQAPKLRRLNQGSFEFVERARGYVVRVQYEVSKGLLSVQDHVFRVDHRKSWSVLTQLTATATSSNAVQLDLQATPVIRTFTL